MADWLARTELLLGAAAMEKLAAARVAVFGIGGVGGTVCEALCRSGVGALDLVDSDRVAVSNLNRQIIATQATVGQLKVEAMRARILSINPQTRVTVWPCFFLPENADTFPFADYDYVVDAVDTVSAKLALAARCQTAGVQLISCMGAGNKLDPTAFKVSDISKTRIDPLARVMRKELKKRGVEHLKVVWSEEAPHAPAGPPLPDPDHPGRRAIPGSTAFVPAAAGLVLAAEVVKDLTDGIQT